MHWKTILGALLLFGALKEMLSVMMDYRSGKLTSWPFGVEAGCVVIAALGVYLIRKGQKQKKLLSRK